MGILLKCTVKEHDVNGWIELICLSMDQMVECEHGDESSGSVICGEQNGRSPVPIQRNHDMRLPQWRSFLLEL